MRAGSFCNRLKAATGSSSNSKDQSCRRIIVTAHRVASGDARAILSKQYHGLGSELSLVNGRSDVTMEMVDRFLTKMYRTNPDFVFHCESRFRTQLPDSRTD